DGDNQLTDTQFRGTAEGSMGQAIGLQAQHREIGCGIIADQLGIELSAIAESRRQLASAGDDMAIGEEIPIGRKQDPRPGTVLMVPTMEMLGVDMHDGWPNSLKGMGHPC